MQANNLGQNWILLRGLTREAAHWGSFETHLQQAFPDAQIHALDLPGTGIYYQQPSPDSIPEITRQIRQQAHENGWLQAKATLLSLSLGGMISWEWLQRYPAEINGAILINTSLATLNPFYHRLRWQNYFKLIQIAMQKEIYRRELAILKLVSNLEENYKTTAREWEQIQTHRPVSLQNAKRQTLAAANYRPALQQPIAPVLLLNSLGDRLVAPCCSTTISKRWSLPLVTHLWAGHDICIDDGAWVINRLLEWVNQERPS
jgi:pimeloyl-[acyl-carrier protein] methyl ester esterase